MRYVEYLHTTLNKIYSIDYEISIAEFYKFQESDNPLDLGFTYERDFTEIHPAKPETV
jgi:hypothetical protein